MKTDINGVPWTYVNKDELDFDSPTLESNHNDLLDKLIDEKEHIEWNIMSNESDLLILNEKIRSLQYEQSQQ